MSSFVVDDVTINNVVSYLYSKGNGPDDWLRYRAVKLAKMGYDLTNPEHCEKVANLMFELNVAAVNKRYGEGEAEKFRPLDFKYLLAYPGSQMQAIKALETWLYQCLEDDIHLHRLYGAMEQIRDMLCIDYVHNSEEYEAVRWG
jgi:hypothetical protein